MNMISATDCIAMYRSLCSAERQVDISSDAKCVLPLGYRLLRIETRGLDAQSDEIDIALVNDIESSVAYHCSLQFSSLPRHARQTVVQKRIWRSPDARHAVVLRDMPKKITFNYILTLYDLLLSQDFQKDLTEYRWLRTLSDALACGAHVYLINRDTGSLQPIRSQAALDEVKDWICSTSNDQAYKLALISKNEILSVLAKRASR